MVKADLPLLRLQRGAKRGVKHWYWCPSVSLSVCPPSPILTTSMRAACWCASWPCCFLIPRERRVKVTHQEAARRGQRIRFGPGYIWRSTLRMKVDESEKKENLFVRRSTTSRWLPCARRRDHQWPVWACRRSPVVALAFRCRNAT